MCIRDRDAAEAATDVEAGKAGEVTDADVLGASGAEVSEPSDEAPESAAQMQFDETVVK